MGGFNPENRFFHVSETELPEAEAALYQLLVPGNKKKAIQLEDFDGFYDSTKLAADRAYVEILETKFKQGGTTETAKKYAELFEAIISDQIENADLMGPDATVIVPSRLDDIRNGVDDIIEFEQERGATSHLALALDVTKNEKEIREKFEKIRDSIENGKLTKIEYFKTKNFRGELKPVARVVVGADRKTTENIANQILQFMRLKETIAERRATKKDPEGTREYSLKLARVRQNLASHPLQEIILTEIRTQLEAFQEYAKSCSMPEAEREYGKIMHIIDEVIAEKDTPSNPNKEAVDNDEVYQLIMENARTFNAH